jgi:DNA-binding SARP family transcriptional activator/tetratricopeptide (TPR) repeat protein
MRPRRASLDIRLLGPVRAYAGGRQLDLGPRKQRLVFAVLALEVNRVVPIERLVELVWPVDAPRTAAHAVRVSVSGLRSVLTGRLDARIETSGAGYALRADPEQIDASRFRGLLKRAAAAADDASRVALLDEALALWSGPAVFGTALSGTAPAETQEVLGHGLEESRLTAVEDRFDAELRRGHHRALLGEITELARAHPTRERLAAQLMMCLYRDGRQTEALDTFRRLRDRLSEQFGVDPGPAVRELHLAILRDDPALQPERPPGTTPAAGDRPARVPAQLPPTVGDFVGRGAEFARLDLFAAAGATTIVVSGMAGVGKTALAVQWAHRVRGEFPDGQLYVNLNGYASGSPVAPARVLAWFLAGLGIPAERIPADEEEATALYRTVLSDRRILVILDNAGGPEQVRPLMPGSPHCRVVVTSRSRLGGLVARDGARSLELGVLTPDEAVGLLATLVGDATDPSVLPELVRLCARLPLALRIAAAQLVRDRRDGDGPHGYPARLADANRLAALEIDDDQEAAVRAAFDLSYAALDAPARRMFRLLGLIPGTDVCIAAAAALYGSERSAAEPVLAALSDSHLVERTGPDRYGLHDLLRLYAGERLDHDETAAPRDSAVGRLEAFYLRATDTAARLLYPTAIRLALPADLPASPAPPLTDPGEASTWLDAERGNLVAVAIAASDTGRHVTAYALGDMLAGYFWMRRHRADWLAVARAALASANAAGDVRAQATSHRALSGVYLCSGRFHAATAELDRGLALASRAGWREGEAAMLNSRAAAAQDLGDTEQAERDYVAALALYRAAGHRTGEPVVLSNLGGLYGRTGRLQEAADAFRQALAVDQRLGATGDVGIDLSNLGGACWRLGRLDEAVQHLSAGLDVHREVGNRAGEANTLNYLARVHHDAGRDEMAATVAEADLAKALEIGDPLIEVDAWNAVAGTRSRLGRQREAADARRRALDLAGTTGYRYGAAEALLGLAASSAEARVYTDSVEHARRALAVAQKARFLVLEGHARAALAAAHLGTGDLDGALAEAEAAETIYRDTCYRLGLARALRLLGDIVVDRCPDRAEAARREALALFTEIGTPEADGSGPRSLRR